MNHIQKKRNNNRAAILKNRSFINELGIPAHELKVQPSKVPRLEPTNNNNRPPAHNSKPLPKEEDDQSNSFDMAAFVAEKRSQGQAPRVPANRYEPNRLQASANPQITAQNSQSDFRLSEFEYGRPEQKKIEQAGERKGMGIARSIFSKPSKVAEKVSKQRTSQGLREIRNKSKEWKEPVVQIFNSKLKPVTKEDYQDKVKMQDLEMYFKPRRRNYIMANNAEWQHHNKEMDYRLDYILSKFPRIKAFKNNQKAIIKCAMEGNDVFVCMPTGGGKSLTFQTLSFLIKGVYLCVLPLISLIFDQESQANMLGIQAYSLTANTKQHQTREIYNKLSSYEPGQDSIVLFCTPQKLNLSPQFEGVLRVLYSKGLLVRAVIDEVHCVSTWGKQFRKQYTNLNKIKETYPKTPILALTATVTQDVKMDIIKKLHIENCYFFQSSFNRPNLHYSVRPKGKESIEDIQGIIMRYPGKSGIIYCLSRKNCEEMSDKLNRRGYRAAFYHAEIKEDNKREVQQRWMKNEIHIIVATVAFGMGINKPDVRYVIHETMSKSLENYYQESGRAGRDGEESECILFYKKGDKTLLQNMTLRNDYSTRESKEFSTRQLAQMIKYCQDKSTCRRQFQLRYLGQTDFDPADCHKTCDNCEKGDRYTEFECLTQGTALVKAMVQIEQSQIRLSKNQLIGFIRNKPEKSAAYKMDHLRREIGLEALQEEFEGWRVDELDNFILELICNDIFSEQVVQNNIRKGRMNNSVMNIYLKCNAAKCNMFLSKVQSIPFKREIRGSFVRPQQKNNDFSFLEQDMFSEEEMNVEQTIEDPPLFQEKREEPMEQPQQSQRNQKMLAFIESIFQDDSV